MKDELFLRGAQVPMTKEAVRALALAKLELHRARHLIDIGAGTGSVSIEAALQNPKMSCFARRPVPMTKEAVRALALAKLELHRARHLIDIGAGTGSVSIEAALQNPVLRVTAIERHRYRGGRCAAGGRRQSRRDLYGRQRRPPDGADRLVAGAAASWRP